jgi:hypothetical protein
MDQPITMNFETFYYRSLDIPNIKKINQEFNQFLDENKFFGGFVGLDVTDTMKYFPTLEHWFTLHNLKVLFIAYILVPANSVQALHKDSGGPCLALNFPLRHCEGTYTNMFVDKGVTTTAYTKGTHLSYLKYVDLDPIINCTYELLSPTLIHIKKPHQVCNNTSNDRISLSFRFKEDPWFLIS